MLLCVNLPSHASSWDSAGFQHLQTLGLELYDHRDDPPALDFDASENENVAANASHAAVIAELGARLRAMFP